MMNNTLKHVEQQSISAQSIHGAIFLPRDLPSNVLSNLLSILLIILLRPTVKKGRGWYIIEEENGAALSNLLSILLIQQ